MDRARTANELNPARIYLVGRPKREAIRSRTLRRLRAVQWFSLAMYAASAAIASLGVWKAIDLAAALGRMFW